MSDLWRDLRYTLRGLLKSPAFTLVALATLALGIGVNSSIFSLVNAILYRPLPVESPEELVDVYGHSATSSTHDSNSYPNYLDYREQTETLSGLIAYSNFFANLSIEGGSELAVGEIVTDNYFDVLGVEPAHGRSFVPEEFTAPGAGPVAVISHPFWVSRFGADPDALGRTFRLNGLPYTIVGVAPEDFGGMMRGATAQMWIPISMVEEVEPLGNQRNSGPSTGPTRLDRRGQHWLWMRGRMRPDIEVGQVRAEFENIAGRLAAEYPETNDLERVTVLKTSDVAINPDFDGTLRPAGLVLLGAVGLVLLIACANLANMMLARASSRRREFAVRLAIGAGRRRLIRQLLTESTVLALAGGAIAFGLARWLTGGIARIQPPLPVDVGLDISPDWSVFVFTLAVAVGTGILFGLVPALRATRPDLVPALKETGEGDAPGRKLELRDLLVVVQVATSLVLLVSAALLVRSLDAAQRVDFGYDVDRVAYFGLAMEMNGYDAEESGVFYREAVGRIEALPAVDGVALTSRVPLSLNNNGFGIFIDGRQSSRTDEPFRMDGARVDEGYFETLELEIVAGRAIRSEDREGPARVAVVTETMADRYWPGESAIGKEFRISWGAEPHRVVGVVEDYKVDTPGEAPKPYLHLPLRPETVFANILVRTSAPAENLVPTLEEEMRVLDPDLVFLDTGTERELADVRLFAVQAGGWLIGAFGVLAVLLAAVGLYGVISYSVSRRTREIGIRKALGAGRNDVVQQVVRRGMVLIGVGGFAGAVLALLGARALSWVLFVDAFDPWSFGAAAAVIVAVGVLANWVPARRATRVDPVRLLRAE